MNSWENTEQHGEREKINLYHGISSTQRGGDAATKLLSMIDAGVIYPLARGQNPGEDIEGQEAEDLMDKLHVAIFRHALKNGRDTGKIDVEKYLRDHANDTQLMSEPGVREYANNDTFRKALHNFGFSTIDLEKMERTHATWADEEEDYIADTYGDEIYLEFTQDVETIHRKVKSASTAIVPGPIDFMNVNRIVLAPRFALKAKEIQQCLHKKGFNHIQVEVRH